MGRRDDARLAAAEFVELGGNHVAIHALGLIDDQMQRPAGAAQQFGDHLVLRRQAGADIDEEQQHIGLGDRRLGLTRHFMDDAVLGLRLEAAGIDDQKGPLAEPAMAVMAIARQAGLVGDEGVARLGQAVEQRRSCRRWDDPPGPG